MGKGLIKPLECPDRIGTSCQRKARTLSPAPASGEGTGTGDCTQAPMATW